MVWCNSLLHFFPLFFFNFTFFLLFCSVFLTIIFACSTPMTPYSVWPWCLLHQHSVRVPPLWWIQNEIVTWCLASGNKQDFINTSTTGRKNGHLWWTKGRREDLHLWCSDRLDSPPAWNSRAAEQPSKTLCAKPPIKGPRENLTSCTADWDRGTRHGQGPVPQLSDSN